MHESYNYEKEMQDAEFNARESHYAELDYISSFGLCNGCNHMDYDLGMCLGYNMPLHVIGGRKTKCKRLDNTPRPEIKEDWSGY